MRLRSLEFKFSSWLYLSYVCVYISQKIYIYIYSNIHSNLTWTVWFYTMGAGCIILAEDMFFHPSCCAYIYHKIWRSCHHVWTGCPVLSTYVFCNSTKVPPESSEWVFPIMLWGKCCFLFCDCCLLMQVPVPFQLAAKSSAQLIKISSSSIDVLVFSWQIASFAWNKMIGRTKLTGKWELGAVGTH